MERELKALEMNISHNAMEIAMNAENISSNAANISSNAANQDELELKQEQDFNWLNDTIVELLEIPPGPCPNDQIRIKGVCSCTNGTFKDSTEICRPCQIPAGNDYREAMIINDICYIFSEVKVDRVPAEEKCLNSGAKLWEPKSQAQNDAVTNE